MMKTVLVTGGAGFFGGVLKRELLARNYSCVSLDIVPDEDSHPNLTSYQADIRDRAAVDRVFSAHSFDGVAHCAAMLAHELKDMKALWASNVDGTRNVADAAVAHGVKHLVFTSSNCLWGEPFGRAVREDDVPAPIEVYGESKHEGEKILQEYGNELNAVIIRCPTIIDFGRLGLLAILFEFIDEHRRVWTVGGGTNRYQFIYAKDLADACIRALGHTNSDVFNIGSDDVKSLGDVYRYVVKQAGSRSKVASLPLRPTIAAMKLAHKLKISPLGPYHYKMIAEDFLFDTSKIKEHLGWRPTLTNEQMLLCAYQYYSKNRREIESRTDVSDHRRAAKMGVIRLLKWAS